MSGGNPRTIKHALPDSPPRVMEGAWDSLIHTWDPAAFTLQGLENNHQPSFPLILPSSPSIHLLFPMLPGTSLLSSSLGPTMCPLVSPLLTRDFDICLKVLLSTANSSAIWETSFSMSVSYPIPPGPPRQCWYSCPLQPLRSQTHRQPLTPRTSFCSHPLPPNSDS